MEAEEHILKSCPRYNHRKAEQKNHARGEHRNQLRSIKHKGLVV